MIMPKGGDGRTDSISGRSDARRTVTLAAGVLRNPATPGSYTLQGAFTSVDPDTGGANDGQGESPFAFVTEAASCPACVVNVAERTTADACDDGDPCTAAACASGRCDAEALLRATSTKKARAAGRKLTAARRMALKQIKKARKTRALTTECADSIDAVLADLRSP